MLEQGRARGECRFLEGPVASIVEQEIGQLVIRDKGVHVTVLVIVRKGDTHPPAHVLQDAGLFRNIFKRSVASIMVQRVGQSLEVLGVAVNPDVPLLVSTEAVVRRRPPGIIDDKQIKPPVVVIVEPPSRHRPHRALNSSPSRHVFEPALPGVAIQNVAIHSGDEDIHVAVIVVIRCGNAHRITCPSD